MIVLSILLACRTAAPTVAEAAPTDALAAPGSRGVLPTVCEASALLVTDDGLLLADNETKARIYEPSPDFTTLRAIDVGAEIDDIEALAGTKTDLWIVGSQSANKEGERRPARERIVHVTGDGQAKSFTPDLSICADCEAVRMLAPKRGGRNVEGAAFVGDQLWLGLRSPLVDGKAVFLRMGPDRTRADRMVLVDLGGQGVREMVAHDGALLVVSGPLDDDAAPHHLWRMSAPGSPPVRMPLELPSQVEGIAVVDDRLVWVTDGSGKPGKCESPSRWGVESYAAER